MGQENDQNQVGEQSCEVHNLQKDERRVPWSTLLDTVAYICEEVFEYYASELALSKVENSKVHPSNIYTPHITWSN